MNSLPMSRGNSTREDLAMASVPRATALRHSISGSRGRRLNEGHQSTHEVQRRHGGLPLPSGPHSLAGTVELWRGVKGGSETSLLIASQVFRPVPVVEVHWPMSRSAWVMSRDVHSQHHSRDGEVRPMPPCALPRSQRGSVRATSGSYPRSSR